MGPGRRIDIVLQGCSIASGGNPCYKCFSKDLWDANGGDSLDVDKVIKDVTEIIVGSELSGVTITGGEPTDQHEQLLLLLRGIKDRLLESNYPIEVDYLLFSWFYEKQFALRFSDLYLELDALVLGPYQYEKSQEQPLIATSNQELILNSNLARARYSDLSDMPRLDFAVSALDNSLLFIGMSHKDEMDKIKTMLSMRGIKLDYNSWE
jgi:anaerobic ribonucleoside-triphosphate reductase activating protein